MKADEIILLEMGVDRVEVKMGMREASSGEVAPRRVLVSEYPLRAVVRIIR